MLMKKIGLYVHIPFCNSKCNYCDFGSHVADYKEKSRYLSALKKEISLQKERTDIDSYEVDTVFIGGGTPTSLSEDLLFDLLYTLKSSFNIAQNAESTIEMNPNSVTESKIDIIASSFINRVSIGLQSADENELKLLGRTHSLADFDKTCKMLRKHGIKNINADLIMGLPGQKQTDFARTLETVLSYNIEHISAYMLIIEEGTPFYNMCKNGLITVDEEETLKIYEYTVDELAKRGYGQYEISNFAKKGKRCAHNIKYWTDKEYIGIGGFAASYFGGYRYKNAEDDYVSIVNTGKLPIIEKEISTQKIRYEERIFLGLRMTDGIDIDKINVDFGIDFEKKYEKQLVKILDLGLIRIHDGKLSLTLKGIEVSNRVFLEFI